MIPRRLIRTVPAETTDQVEQWWRQACEMHPTWDHITYREPVDPRQFPVTSHLFPTSKTGAQRADLIRAEALYRHGGIYLDSDVEVYRSLEPLTHLQGFAAWEDIFHIPNAVMGFEAAHPAIRKVMELAVERHHLDTWSAGVGVTTEVFRGRDDMALLPPGSIYPVYWRDAATTDWSTVVGQNPWAYCGHHAHHSWK